jgi:hypothetical protein
MKILIGVATYQRPEKLKRLLKSLEQQTYKNFFTVVVFDANDWASAKGTREYTLPIGIQINNTRDYVIGCWNLAHKYPGFDAHLMLCDDVELHRTCLESALEALKTRFPDGDGVVGITQECPGVPNYTYKPFGQTLMGKKFIERFKEVDYQVCCPFYTHFYQDEEMWQYMSELNKTYHCKEAILNHYHPAFKREELDSTHGIVRVPELFKKDKELFMIRQSEGKLWGKTWEK